MAFNYKDTSPEHLNAHIDRLLEVMKEIDLYKVTILTGGNALGKSLIRKQLPFRLDEKLNDLGIKHDIRRIVASSSMQLRTENRSEWGALSTMAHDTPWSSTSDSTIHMIKQLLRHGEEGEKNKRFLVIDEVEIGMSREVQIGMARYLDSMLNKIIENSYGILIITHSADVVKNIKHDHFINIEGMSEEEWLNREIVPVEPEDLEKWADELFCAVRDREHKV